MLFPDAKELFYIVKEPISGESMNYTDSSEYHSDKSIRLKVQKDRNYLEEFVEVEAEPESCSKTMNCEHQGAINIFRVDFKLRKENRGKHTVKLGLRGGKLKLFLDPVRAKKLQPKNIIKQKLNIKEESNRYCKTKFSVIDPTISEKHSEKTTSTKSWIIISCGGTPKEPIWSFEAYRNSVLEGITENLICKVKPEKFKHCRYKYIFLIDEGDWFYDITIHPDTNFLLIKYTKLILRSYCRKQIRKIHSDVVKQFRNIIARGRWICLAKK